MCPASSGGVAAPVQQMLPERAISECQPPHGRAGDQRHHHSAEVDFAPANFIITPTEQNTPEAVAWCRDLAQTLGFARITTLSIAEHDRMIGYVSQLCHAIAVSLMCASDNSSLADYTGDSFRDLTRIARINEKLWAELFLWNRDNLIGEIDMFDAALQKLRGFFGRRRPRRPGGDVPPVHRAAGGFDKKQNEPAGAPRAISESLNRKGGDLPCPARKARS